MDSHPYIMLRMRIHQKCSFSMTVDLKKNKKNKISDCYVVYLLCYSIAGHSLGALMQGPVQRLVSGGRSRHQNVNFYTTAMFFTQNTQFSMFFQLLWWAACQSAGSGRQATPTVGRKLLMFLKT